MKRLKIFMLVLILAMLSACASPAPVETEAPASNTPQVGGTLIVAWPQEPRTLDPALNGDNAGEFVSNLIGANLATYDPEGNLIPYLAESWTISEDGMVWEFKLRKDIKYSDGTPVTAHDFAWEYKRAMNPETASPAAGTMLAFTADAEAVDDNTLKLTFAVPFYGFGTAITNGGYLQPVPQAAVEANPEAFGKSPIGAGPYILKEWVTGEKIVLERNPNFTWDAAFTHGGPYYIQNIEVRYIPEYTTIVAGLEAGEIDYAVIQAKDVQRIKDTGKFQVYESIQAGVSPYISLNTSVAPFDDLKVRQAFNHAVDKETLIKVAALGAGVIQDGSCSSTQFGCWSATQEDFGYDFDLEKAKQLMQAAGYTAGANGILEKDGAPLKLTLLTDAVRVKVAEVLQKQYQALGVEIEIQTVEGSIMFDTLRSGDYQIALNGVTYPTTDLEMAMFHSEFGAYNFGFYTDSALDDLVMGIIVTMDPAANAEAQQALEQHIMEQAYIVPLYSPVQYIAVSNRVKGSVFSEKVSLAAGLTQLYLNDAWLEEK